MSEESMRDKINRTIDKESRTLAQSIKPHLPGIYKCSTCAKSVVHRIAVVGPIEQRTIARNQLKLFGWNVISETWNNEFKDPTFRIIAEREVET